MNRLIIILLTLFTNATSIGQIYVDASNSNTAQTGSSWEKAFTELEDALSIATNGDVILVAKGVYYPKQGWDIEGNENNVNQRKSTFRIPSNVKIYGGFDGNEINFSEEMLNSRDFDTNETILSGDIGVRDDIGDNVYHIVQFIDVTDTTELNGFTLKDGLAYRTDSSSYFDNFGGAIINMAKETSSNPIVKLCNFENNLAVGGGGAIYNIAYTNSANPIIDNCFFSNNLATVGGAFYNYTISNSASPVFNSCKFDLNNAGNGGAIANNLESENNALIGEASPIFKNCHFTNNSATIDNGRGNGGALFNSNIRGLDANPIFINCFFKNNYADFYGGVLLNNVSMVNVNKYSWIEEASPSFINCLFTDNESGLIGGVAYNSSALGKINSHYTNCTFVNNSSNLIGGIFNQASVESEIDLNFNNCVFWDNLNSNNSQSHWGNVTANISVSNSLISEPNLETITTGNYEGTIVNSDLLYNEDPKFKDLDNKDYYISSDSPMIDKGSNNLYNSLSNKSQSDLAGNQRIDSIIDIGCYEYGTEPVLSFTDFNELEKETFLKIYPNPTNGLLSVNTDFDKIEIYSLKGNNVYNTKTDTINISHLAQGVYFVKIFLGDDIVTKKLIKK